MADNKPQGPTARKAPDPTVVGRRGDIPEYPPGTHPPVPPSEQTWGPDRFKYADLEDRLKPDETTIAQTVVDPLEAKQQKAQREAAD